MSDSIGQDGTGGNDSVGDAGGVADGKVLALRHIARDDLLHLAAEASAAVTVLESDSDFGSVSAPVFTGPAEAYPAAIEVHLARAAHADHEGDWASRAQSLLRAAVLGLFCRELDKRGFAMVLPAGFDERALYEKALGELASRDPSAVVTSTGEYARAHRLLGDYSGALGLTDKSATWFEGSGASSERAYYERERAFTYILAEQSEVAGDSIAESKGHWRDPASRAGGFAAGGGWEQATAVAGLATDVGPDVDRATARAALTAASAQLAVAAECFAEHEASYLVGQVERLSIAVTRAEWAQADDQVPRDEVVSHCADALDLFEALRFRWAVVARSAGPLALVLRLVLGDVAAVLAAAGGQAAARLGLRLAVSAKHSAFAELVRTQRGVLDRRAESLVTEIVDIEQKLAADDAIDPVSDEERLRQLRTELEYSVSRLLANIVIPFPVDIEPVLEQTAGKVVLDFVRLPPSDGLLRWYRTTVYGPEDIEFAVVETGSGYQAFCGDGMGNDGPLKELQDHDVDDHKAWRQAATELLPQRLLEMLAAPDTGDDLELLVSPHADLTGMPWVGLKYDDDHRVVERARVTHTPLLTAYSGEPPAPLAGPALVAVDAKDLKDSCGPVLDSLGLPDDAVLQVAGCRRGSEPEALDHGFAAALTEKHPWQFAYVMSHGVVDSAAASGFGQHLRLGDIDLTAGEALGLRWPPSVMLAACSIGEVADGTGAEPMGFVLAAMAGGARCVVTSLKKLGRTGAAQMSADVVAGIDGSAPLQRVAQQAQRNQTGREQNGVLHWAPLAVFVR